MIIAVVWVLHRYVHIANLTPPPPYTLPTEESLLKDTLILAQGVRSEGHLEGQMKVTLYHPLT